MWRKVNIYLSYKVNPTFALKFYSMQCLLIAATAKEILPFINHYRSADNKMKVNVDILITGIGLTATTYHLTRQISLKKPDLVVQAGIAGCFQQNIALGSVVAVKQDCIADETVVEKKKLKSLFDLQLAEPNGFPYKNKWLVNRDTELFKKNKYKTVKSVSVNHITTDKKMIAAYIDKFKPAIETMEGAALHYVCLSEKIPFLQLRSISNYIGERDKKKWNIKDAIQNLNNELIRLLESL